MRGVEALEGWGGGTVERTHSVGGLTVRLGFSENNSSCVTDELSDSSTGSPRISCSCEACQFL